MTNSSALARHPGAATERHVCVAISGGVDSAVCAMLLRDQGHAVRGLFMKNWEEDDRQGFCAAAADLADAERVCARLGIALGTVNFAAEYWEEVFSHLVAGYAAGRTPNPDVLCNRAVKFGPFLDYALSQGAEWVATGHYARLRRDADGRVHLLKARDTGKDQTYFLCMLDQARLRRVLFPVGEYDKPAVRRLAARAGLAVHAKKDSTGLCFIGERPFRAFLKRFVEVAPGPIEDATGRCIGEHQGAALYTTGQRRGLGIGGGHARGGEPWYVAGRDLARNVLVAVQGRDHPRLWHQALRAGDEHWVSGFAPPLPLRCASRIRHRQREQPCIVSRAADGRLEVEFDAAQWAVSPGQWVVFYAGEECLGGALIDEAR